MVAVLTMALAPMSDEGGSLTNVGISITLHIIGVQVPSPIADPIASRRGLAAR